MYGGIDPRPWPTAITGREPVSPQGIAPVALPEPNLTLVEGTTFCVSGHDGDIDPLRVHGLFVRDTRVISRWQLTVDGRPLEPLTSIAEDPYRGVILSRCHPRGEHPEGTIVVERSRLVAGGMREDILVSNFGLESAGLDLALDIDADFADLFEVKGHRAGATKRISHRYSDGEVVFWFEDSISRAVSVSSPDAQAIGRALVFRLVVPPRSSWSTSVQVVATIDGEAIAESFPTDTPIAFARPAMRMKDWRAVAPSIRVESIVLQDALDQSQRDLGALRIADPEHPDDDVVAAGVPWFMALFGRDSLLTSHFMLPFAPQLALGTLRTLARLQGTRVDARSEEQPGKVLHEVRLGAEPGIAFGDAGVYFGSLDSTPLFIQLCGYAAKSGILSGERLLELQPAIRNALAWLGEYGDKDGDGFLEYERTSDRGLRNQGWKDSQDSMTFSDGARARTPIAPAEAQAYCYGAYLAAADLERGWGNEGAARAWSDKAAALKRAFHGAYWVPELGCYAMALDRDKRPLDVVSSNVGHVLWTGLADERVVPQIVDALMSPSMFTGFGIRTLSKEAAAYNPASYHNGSVWPHDTTIAAAGLARYGYREESTAVIRGLIDALEAFGGRLPELFCGFARTARPTPVPYPTSCSPQAWAAAAPYELLRLSMNLEIRPEDGSLQVAATPDFVGEVEIDGLPLLGRRLAIRADPSGAMIRN